MLAEKERTRQNMNETRTTLTTWIEASYVVAKLLTAIVAGFPLLLLWEVLRQKHSVRAQ
jgi:hypothetical protein